jgi:type I restriction enzyme S subunit
MVVPQPPLIEQRKIAAILSSVDDTIEATQAVIDVRPRSTPSC